MVLVRIALFEVAARVGNIYELKALFSQCKVAQQDRNTWNN